MKVPNAERAKVAREKVLDYLLDVFHLEGQSKAEFFLQAGYSPEEWGRFAVDLAGHARDNEVDEISRNAWGTKYSVVGKLRTPCGQEFSVRTVWIMESGETEPRLVTAYPV